MELPPPYRPERTAKSGFSILPSSEDENDKIFEKPTTSLITTLSSKFNDYWVWEIILCTGSLLSLAAIIGVLLAYNGKATPNWPQGITINSFLSWLSQILTACMAGAIAASISQSKWAHFSTGDRSLADMNLYDRASRGILGSAIFLWRSKMRRSAVLGATVTVLAVGVGPFVQQMVTIKNNWVELPHTATVNRAELYAETYHNPLVLDMFPSLYMPMFASLYTNNSAPKAWYSSSIPNCSTGTCDFPTFQSLAVCSQCSDLTHVLETKRTIIGVQPGRYNVSFDYTLPNGLQTHVEDSFGTRNGTLTAAELLSREDALQPYVSVSSSLTYPYGNNRFGQSALLNLSVIRIDSGGLMSNATAVECVLYWCVNTYSVRMQEHTLHETILDTYSNRDAQYENHSLQLQPPSRHGVPDTIYIVDELSSKNLSSWFDSRLMIKDKEAENCHSTASYDDCGFELSGVLSNASIPYFASMAAEGITASVRKSSLHRMVELGDDYYNLTFCPPVNGTSWVMKTQIHVRWGWIGLPTVLILLCTTHFIISALQSRKQKLQAWKMSTIPLLCSELDPHIQQMLMDSGDPMQTEELAERIRVRLVRHDNGETWRLKMAGSED
ncbi:hypothetical protein BDV25DRAFT_136840 [Aspergillus avenaceus]|uniref:Uncharacterized protein n=1 Tax=Aspergillus avenaceus TaxID=36643 RepID=A0A5N6U4I5_ASPAV|nr:hypothetical protein BDV25DRAFT_136840 [Aspergillus avenaceus]